ncbi:MAG: SIR2 family protein [Saprospiraceae bacterium]|nr:SIR2 family protein [Saprospiraceae bacterium]
MEEQNAYEALVNALSLNYINNSLKNIIIDNKHHEAYREILDKPGPKHSYPFSRNIVIVGAGASHNACSEIKLAKQAGEHLLGKFSKIKDLIDGEIKNLSSIYQLKEEDFETKLLAINKFYPKELKKELKELYDHRYYPNLTYEIIAHLFKHRFIDAIVNFNFDEILDRAIEDELQPYEYDKIISDGDYDQLDNTSEIGLKRPIYIKPHGTISHESTLRFTRVDYFGMPHGIESALIELIRAHVNLVNTQVPVNLIVIGYNMQSAEFNHILRDNLPNNSKIFQLTPEKSIDTTLDEWKDKKEIKYCHSEDFPYSGIQNEPDGKTKPYDLDGVMNQLWKDIEGNFKKQYKPRGIDRHILLAKLLHSDELISGKEKIHQYIKDRTYFEFALSMFKYKGFMSVVQLNEDRFGKYLNFYRKYSPGTTALDFIKKFDLRDFAYGKKAFIMHENEQENALVLKKDEFGKYIVHKGKYWKRYISKSVVDRFEDLVNDPNEIHPHVRVQNIFLEGDEEVSPKYSNIYQNLFSRPLILPTKLSLNYHTTHFINHELCNTLFCVAETGEWLLKEIDMLRKSQLKQIYLIIADTTYQEDLKNKFRDLLPECDLHVRHLDWWSHNQHMSIFLQGIEVKRTKGKNKQSIKELPWMDYHFNALAAIYFNRSFKNSFINPVLLTGNDAMIPIESFIAYWLKTTLTRNVKRSDINLERFKVLHI